MQDSKREFSSDQLCRGCLCASTDFQSFEAIIDTGDEENIIDVTSDATTVLKMFMECTSLSVAENDGLPEVLCTVCVEELAASYNFRNKCRNTDRELRQSVAPVIALGRKQDDSNASSSKTEYAEVQVIDALKSVVVEHFAALYPCRKCFKFFTKESDVLAHHYNTHRLREEEHLYMCAYCYVYGWEYDEFMEHVSEAHDHEHHEFQCGYCEAQYDDQLVAEVHITAHRNENRK